VSINATLLAQLAVFFILAWFTMRFVWPPLTRALDERARKVADGLAAADKARIHLDTAQKKSADELRKAREAGSELRAGAEKQAAQIVDEARQEASHIVAAAREAAEKEAATASQRAKEALRERVADLAVAGAERILRKEIDAKKHADLLAGLKSELR
jgi:F-type H+-transporting ATPase subunit b